MQQSFTEFDALAKWFFDNFPMFADIVLDFSIQCVTEFTEFTDASMPPIKYDAGMSKHRLSPYNAYYHN